MARKHHPDVAPDKAKAQQLFAQINRAYQVLHDPKQRAEYDRTLPATPPPPKRYPPRSPLASPAMEHLVSEAEGDALAQEGRHEQALIFYRLAQGRRPNPALDAKIARLEAFLAGPGGAAPVQDKKPAFWRRWFRRE